VPLAQQPSRRQARNARPDDCNLQTILGIHYKFRRG
jgi:hypothetical protein